MKHKYIDSEKLLAELRRQKHELKLSIQSQGDYGQSCQIVAYENICNLITSLQQEEQQLIGGQVFGATDVNQLYEGKVYIISNLVQDIEFGLSIRDKVKILLIKD